MQKVAVPRYVKHNDSALEVIAVQWAGNHTWGNKVLDRTITRGWLKAVPGLKTPNMYELHAKKTISNAWIPRQTTASNCRYDVPNEANKT